MRYAEKRMELGFTLVEVLVALVVTALLMAIVIDGAATARDRNRASAEKREAVLLAQGLLTQASVENFQKTPRSGTSGRLAWQLSENVEKTDRRGIFGLIRIEARIETRKGRPLLAVDTLRIKTLAGS